MTSLDRKVQEMTRIDRAAHPRFVAALSLFVLLCVGLTGCCCPKPECPRNGGTNGNGEDNENGGGEDEFTPGDGPPGPSAMRRVRLLNTRADRMGNFRAVYKIGGAGTPQPIAFQTCEVHNNEAAFALIPQSATHVMAEFDVDVDGTYEYTGNWHTLDPNAPFIEWFLGISEGPPTNDSHEWLVHWYYQNGVWEAHCARWGG